MLTSPDQKTVVEHWYNRVTATLVEKARTDFPEEFRDEVVYYLKLVIDSLHPDLLNEDQTKKLVQLLQLVDKVAVHIPVTAEYVSEEYTQEMIQVFIILGLKVRVLE